MRAGVIVTAVLGLGTIIVFVAAAMTATLFPNGTMVGAGFNGGAWGKGGIAVPVPMPVPVNLDPTLVDPAPDLTDEPLDALPVVTDAGVDVVTEVTPAP